MAAQAGVDLASARVRGKDCDTRKQTILKNREETREKIRGLKDRIDNEFDEEWVPLHRRFVSGKRKALPHGPRACQGCRC